MKSLTDSFAFCLPSLSRNALETIDIFSMSSQRAASSDCFEGSLVRMFML
jgi:hypothetical protein